VVKRRTRGIVRQLWSRCFRCFRRCLSPYTARINPAATTYINPAATIRINPAATSYGPPYCGAARPWSYGPPYYGAARSWSYEYYLQLLRGPTLD